MESREERLLERLSIFKKASSGMIATSDKSYDNKYFTKSSQLIAYTPDQVKQIILSGDPSSLKNLSRLYFYNTGFYRRIIVYYATILKYSTVTIPHVLDNKKSIEDDKLSKRYYEAIDFAEQLKIPTMSTAIAIKVLVDGAYYGIIQEGDTGITLQDLPFDYCRSRFKNHAGSGIVELNLKYFDTFKDETQKKEALAVFPKEVLKAYNSYLKDANLNWAFIPDTVGVYFSLIEEKPFFLNIIPSTIEYEEYRVIEKNKDTAATKKLLIQRMPISNDGELIFEPEEAEEMHRASVGMLKKNPDINVLTTYGEVTVESMLDARQTITDNLEKVEKAIFSNAGVTRQLFAADGNIALDKSLQNDLSLMMVLGQDIASFFTDVINVRFGDNKITFKNVMLPISHYNIKEFSENAYKLATAGYSALIPALTTGISQRDLMDIKKLENALLKVNELLIPLQTSATLSKNENGAPAVPDAQKKDKTIANQNTV